MLFQNADHSFSCPAAASTGSPAARRLMPAPGTVCSFRLFHAPPFRRQSRPSKGEQQFPMYCDEELISFYHTECRLAICLLFFSSKEMPKTAVCRTDFRSCRFSANCYVIFPGPYALLPIPASPAPRPVHPMCRPPYALQIVPRYP